MVNNRLYKVFNLIVIITTSFVLPFSLAFFCLCYLDRNDTGMFDVKSEIEEMQILHRNQMEFFYSILFLTLNITVLTFSIIYFWRKTHTKKIFFYIQITCSAIFFLILLYIFIYFLHGIF